MSPVGRVITFRVEPDVLDGMHALRERDGIPMSEQIRRAIRAWLESKRLVKAERKRADTRRAPKRRQQP